MITDAPRRLALTATEKVDSRFFGTPRFFSPIVRPINRRFSMLSLGRGQKKNDGGPDQWTGVKLVDIVLVRSIRRTSIPTDLAFVCIGRARG